MNNLDFKRSPIVLIRTFILIEVAGFLCYLVAAALGNYKYDLYVRLSLSSLLSYQAAKFMLLSGAQLIITIYAFIHWHRESYAISQNGITHSWGVFFRKNKVTPLSKSTSLTLSSSPIGKMFHYGSIKIKNDSIKNFVVLSDIPYPKKHFDIIKKIASGQSILLDKKPDTYSLIGETEHEQLEFKSSLRFDRKNNQVNRDLEKATMKTVAAFLNSKGGNLLIGIDDSRKPLGLLADYKTLPRGDRDGFENHFTQVFNSMIGPEFRHLVKLWFNEIDEFDVCTIQVAPSARPAYLKLDGDERFYVRTGNITTQLKLSEVESYARTRWPRRLS